MSSLFSYPEGSPLEVYGSSCGEDRWRLFQTDYQASLRDSDGFWAARVSRIDSTPALS